MEGPAEDQGITYQDLLCYFETHGDAAEMRREQCDQEEEGVCSRWKPFEAFRREVQGEEVMTSTDNGILRDYLPGTYPMAEIVQFTDLPDLLPARASVQGARLVSFLSQREIHQSLKCKIFQYTFLRQYPMKFQNFFLLCKIYQLV